MHLFTIVYSLVFAAQSHIEHYDD